MMAGRKCRISSCDRPTEHGLYCGRHRGMGEACAPVDTPDPRYD